MSEFYDAGYNDGINDREANSDYAEGYELGLADAEGRAS